MTLRILEFKRKPKEDVVRLLRELLERAERGAVVSFAGVAVLATGHTLEAWTKKEATRLAGTLVRLQWRIARWMNDEE